MLLLGYERDGCWCLIATSLAVMSVAESQRDRCARCQQAGFMNLQVARLDYEIEACFPVTGALLTRACMCGGDSGY